ncbi:MAG: DNA helicase RecG, partial [Anaerotignum sp.]|nr:DNA helicase RecG [Anaerotignum sp.]
MEWNSPVSMLKGIGEQRERKLQKLGISTIEDLLTHYPREYKDRSEIVKIADLPMDEPSTFLAQVKEEGQNSRHGRLVYTRMKVYDETGSVGVLWYNQPYMKNSLKIGEWYLFSGKLQKKYGRKEILSPEVERIGENFAGGRILPVYPASEGISQKMLRNLMEEALSQMSGGMREELPLWLRKEYKLAERNFAIENIHFPKTEQGFYDARRRLVFEELFVLQTALFQLKNTLEDSGEGIVLKKKKALQEAEALLPFALTNAQKRVLKEMEKDMTSGKIMIRLVQGDVGSGKTAVAMVAAYWAIRNGYQATIMAPTEVLATGRSPQASPLPRKRSRPCTLPPLRVPKPF